ncbi:MAG TPA: DUF4838 domain-containing protein [Dinghuibacter sp.]|uniref:DUF4838 domain-containing protein n=1 Tax=Dinghuibacter sp. TaxID=2024697 RepID=UPI002B7020F1|nr:DUF4838 domain-containing protein [Dinghuibacter sp.]HTJ13945.1 DUF4838 domain-containing protein [Dinghuibacter sp.]
MRSIALFVAMGLTGFASSAQRLTLVRDGVSAYRIVLPDEPLKVDRDAAAILQRYIARISGATLPIVQDAAGPAIRLGRQVDLSRVRDDGFLIATHGSDLFIAGAHGRATVYGVYDFLDRYLGCKKYDAGPAYVPHQPTIGIGAIDDLQNPAFFYRETYYPSAFDAEFLEWHHLHQFTDLWGVWGHSFFKYVPPATYFKTHPEYFALVDGQRRATQLCLSNDTVFQLTVAALRERMARHPDALWWSIAPNDDNGYCTCDRCRRMDPTEALIRFVNRVAAVFPDKAFTTLAYGYTLHAPAHTAPASNVYVMLSSIDAPRQKPLSAYAPLNAAFSAWGALTSHLMLWDYTTQFTSYVAPFPDYACLQPNLQYALAHDVRGVFSQGSGETYSDMDAYNAYIQAALLWNPSADVARLTTEFCNGYYGAAAGPFIARYLAALSAAVARPSAAASPDAAPPSLDIYGNPVNERFLSAGTIDALSTLLDKAEAASETAPAAPGAAPPEAARVSAARLPLEYTVLQQSRFYGPEPHGYLEPDGQGGFKVRVNWPARVERFIQACKKAGVKEMSEGGPDPDAYAKEWASIFARGWEPTKALNAKVTLATPFVADYPAKGPRTLTDGVPGYGDFSYNWLCFYGVDMNATIDLGAVMPLTDVHMHFLYDPRHWIFLPSTVRVEISTDGTSYTPLGDRVLPPSDEDYTMSIKAIVFSANAGARYIRVIAANPGALPSWRPSFTKKPMICCDEIFVE